MTRRFGQSGGTTNIGPQLAAGLANGALATLPMSAVMWFSQRAGAMGQMPPGKIADAALEAVSDEPTPAPARRAAAALLHVGFGAAAGALYAWWSARASRRRGALQGMAFGTIVWAGSYAGWIPALGIMAPPHQDRRGRPTSMLIAHWVYGAVLGARLDRAEA